MFMRGALVTVVMLAGVTGCQTYRPKRLRLADYAQMWARQSLDVEPIRAYAAALADAEGASASFDSSDGLSLQEAEAVALYLNPELRVIRAAAEVPLAGAREAGWWPDPQFEGELLRFVNRGDKTRFRWDGPSIDGVNAGGVETTPPGFRRVEGDFIDDPWIVGVGLSVTIPLSGRLAVEQDLRWSQYSAAWRRILVREWEVVTRLRAAWLTWSASVEQLRITRRYVQQLEAIGRMTEQLAAAGEMKPTEARLLRIELARRRTDLLSFEREEERNRLALFALMGLAPHTPIVLHPALSLDAVDPYDEAEEVQLIRNHPRIRAVQADYEVAEQRLRLEIHRQYPDLTVGPSYSFEEGFSRLGLGFGFPIPLWNRNRQAIAEALAAREAARVEAEVTVERVFAAFAQSTAQLKYASGRRAAILRDVAPLVEEQIEDSQTLLELGEVDVLLLRDALTGSLDTKLELLEATLTEELAKNELAQMLHPRWFTPSHAPTEEKEP